MKKVVRENVLRLIQQSTGPLKPRESGVTRLIAIGISNGTAQRVLDDTSDLRLETVEQLAVALKVKPLELMTPGFQAPAMLFRDLNPFEVMLLNLFRDIRDDDEQHAAIVDINQRRDRFLAAHATPAPNVGNPFPGMRERRVNPPAPHIPERRTATHFTSDSPMSSPAPRPTRKRGAQ